MKHLLRIFYSAVAAGGAAATATPLTSDKLEQLKKDLASSYTAERSAEIGSKEFLDARMASLKAESAVKAEEANLKAEDSAAKLAVLRNERVGKLNDYKSAVLVAHAVHADKKSSVDEKNAASDAEKALFDAIANELLGKYATVKPAKLAKDGTAKAAGTKGSTSMAIREKLLENQSAGMSYTENIKAVIAEGFTRGTTGTVATAMKVEGLLS